MKHVRLYVALTALTAVLVSSAQAGGLQATVSRNTMTPNTSQFFPLGSLKNGQVAFGITTPVSGLSNNFDTPDTVAATFLSQDTGPGDIADKILTFNDDGAADNNSGPDSRGSLFRLQAPFDAEYSVGVTGYPNFFDDYGHDEQGDYLLTYATIDPDTPGGDFADTDSTNNTRIGADTLDVPRGTAAVAVNTLEHHHHAPGDVDFYRIDLNAGDVLTAMTAPLGGLNEDFDSPNTTILFFNRLGQLLFDDESAGGPFSDLASQAMGTSHARGSAVLFEAMQSDTYYFAVTGDGDDFGFGNHHQKGDYALLVSVVPEPASLGLLLAGGLALLRRRR